MDVSPDPVPSLSVLANLLKCNGPGPCMLKCMEHCLLAGALFPDVPGGLLPVSRLHYHNTAKLRKTTSVVRLLLQQLHLTPERCYYVVT